MNENDLIETVLKVTGRRPAVPAERSERAREAALAVWRSEVVRRARGRRTAWIVSLASAAVVVAAVGLGVRNFPSPTPPEPSGVRVERVSNVAQLSVGSIVARGTVVVTGADARVALRMPAGHSVRLDVETTARVLSGDELALERGAVYVESSRESGFAGTSVRIDTPVGTIEDEGTQFEARLAGSALSLRVREGVVTVDRPGGRLVARAGQTLRVDASGRVDTGDDAEGAGAWRWVETIAPMMEIEGRPLGDFLDWIARERGARVRFVGAGLEGKARKIVLGGSIAGMSLDEAATSVLATCGLSHRWEDGALVVRVR